MSWVRVPSPAVLDRRCPRATTASYVRRGRDLRRPCGYSPQPAKHRPFCQQVTRMDARGRAYMEGLVQGKPMIGPLPSTHGPVKSVAKASQTALVGERSRRSRASPAVGLSRLPSAGCAAGGIRREHQGGEAGDGPGHVEQLGIGLDVRGEFALGVPNTAYHSATSLTGS